MIKSNGMVILFMSKILIFERVWDKGNVLPFPSYYTSKMYVYQGSDQREVTYIEVHTYFEITDLWVLWIHSKKGFVVFLTHATPFSLKM